MTTKTLLLASTLAALIGGCTTDDAPSAAPSGEFEQLAKVTSFTGTTVELYTAGTGFMFVEYGAKELPRAVVSSEGLSLADVYRVATLQEPPVAIAELSETMGIARATDPHRSVDVTQSAPPVATTVASGGSCSATWMVNQGYCGTGSGRDWSLLNWWNGAYEHLSGVNHSSAWLCADIGNIVWEIHNGDGGSHTWTVLEGQLFNYGLSSDDWFGTWLNYDVTHATDNRFQFCGWAS